MFKQFTSLCALALVAASSLSSVCRAEDETIAMASGKVVVHKPAEWKSVKPKINMIEHEFVAPAEGDAQARITIMSAGGSVEANIDRWVGQFDGVKKEDKKVEDKEVGTSKVHIVDVHGTFVQASGGPFAPGPTTKLENHRLLGVIIETKSNGKIFIKMTGPNDTVEKLKEGMTKLVDSIQIK